MDSGPLSWTSLLVDPRRCVDALQQAQATILSIDLPKNSCQQLSCAVRILSARGQEVHNHVHAAGKGVLLHNRGLLGQIQLSLERPPELTALETVPVDALKQNLDPGGITRSRG